MPRERVGQSCEQFCWLLGIHEHSKLTALAMIMASYPGPRCWDQRVLSGLESSLRLGSIQAECFLVSLSFFSTFSSSAAASQGSTFQGPGSVFLPHKHTHMHTHVPSKQCSFLFQRLLGGGLLNTGKYQWLNLQTWFEVRP